MKGENKMIYHNKERRNSLISVEDTYKPCQGWLMIRWQACLVVETCLMKAMFVGSCTEWMLRLVL